MQLETLQGTVKKIIFESEDGEFTVARFETDEGEFISLVGFLYGIQRDDYITVWGSRVYHPKYGEQLKVSRWEKKLPSNREQLVAYLSSPFVKCVGPQLAEAIADQLGENALELIMEKGYEVLTEVKGIGEIKAKKIHESIVENLEVQHVMKHLLAFGLTPKTAIKAYKEWGGGAVNIVSSDPYRLMDIDSIGFLRADAIAQKLNIGQESPQRIRAAVKYVMEQAEGEGHCYLEREEILQRTQKLLNIEEGEETINSVLEKMLSHGSEIIAEGSKVYPLSLFNAEIKVAEKISRLVANRSGVSIKLAEKFLEDFEAGLGIKLAPEQKEAVLEVLSRGFLILTGGPGTGKTATVNAVINVLRRIDPGAEVILVSPTGRAGQRLMEVTGEKAGTIHRLLNFKPGEGPEFNRDNPLPCDLLVVDEVSMLDIELAASLFDAVDPMRTMVLLVGDADQLPSVGPGNVLHDLMKAGVPTIRLTRIFRQSRESQIVTNAHRINAGKLISIDSSKKDFFFIKEEDPEKIAEIIIQSCRRFVELGYSYSDIQVLSPMRKGPIGTVNLNRRLQELLNPRDKSKKEYRFGSNIYRIGDKIMQTKNNYTKGVFNGDVGLIEDIEEEEESGEIRLTARIREGLVTYTGDEIGEELIPAYCITIHKSQGSEYPIIIMPVSTSHYIMLARNLIYTGITRAKEKVVLVGTMKALAIAVKNNRMVIRNTGLKDKIVQQFCCIKG
ncbi:MAG: ATP-dependent RecD-like DNA helicase [Clostridia bacterium]|nr:ATP-dependent RecD-like DNA helicase [Clostridia bacterium]